MKKFIQDLLISYALAVITIIILSAIRGNWDAGDTRYFVELLFVTIVIRLLILLINKFHSRYPVLEHMLELGMVLAVVLGFGWLLKWYTIDYFWIMIVTIVIIYIGVYVVGIGRTRRDIVFINEQIKLKRARIKGDDCQ